MSSKFTLAGLLMLLSVISSAQFEKGTRMVGASIGSAIFNSGISDITVTSIGSNTATTTSYSISITPSVGWFISRNTAVGVSLNINPAGEKTSYEENGNTFQKTRTPVLI